MLAKIKDLYIPECTVYVDFSKAFDSVDRKLILKSLYGAKVPLPIISILE